MIWLLHSVFWMKVPEAYLMEPGILNYRVKRIFSASINSSESFIYASVNAYVAVGGSGPSRRFFNPVVNHADCRETCKEHGTEVEHV